MLVPIDPRTLPVGTLLRRWYDGREHVVEVGRCITVTPAAAPNGWWRYRYDGKLYRTLTAITRVITGQKNWSGPQFFGLRPRARDLGRYWSYDPTSFLYLGPPKPNAKPRRRQRVRSQIL